MNLNPNAICEYTWVLKTLNFPVKCQRLFHASVWWHVQCNLVVCCRRRLVVWFPPCSTLCETVQLYCNEVMIVYNVMRQGQTDRTDKWHENRCKVRTKVRTFWSWGCCRMSPAAAEGFCICMAQQWTTPQQRDNGAGRQDVEVYQMKCGLHYAWYTVCQNNVNVIVICFGTYKHSPSSPSLSIHRLPFCYDSGWNWLADRVTLLLRSYTPNYRVHMSAHTPTR